MHASRLSATFGSIASVVVRRVVTPELSNLISACRWCSSFGPKKKDTLEVQLGCDLILEGADAKSINQPAITTNDNEIKIPNYDSQPHPIMSIAFTCNVCKVRTQKIFSKKAYTTGMVIIRCPSCQSLHLIADNIGWIKEQTPWRIGQQKHLLINNSTNEHSTAESKDHDNTHISGKKTS